MENSCHKKYVTSGAVKNSSLLSLKADSLCLDVSNHQVHIFKERNSILFQKTNN